jgi:hypothetical protein
MRILAALIEMAVLHRMAVLLRWLRTSRRRVLWAGATVGLLSIAIGYRYGITLWDWIKLLIVPAVIAGGGLWFNAQHSQATPSLSVPSRR